MEEMRQYLFSMFVVAGAASVVVMLSPDGKTGGMRRYIKYLVGLCVCLCLLYPMRKGVSLLRDLPSLPEATADTVSEAACEEVMISYSAACIEQEITRQIQTRYGIDGVEVTLTLDRTDPQSLIITEAELSFLTPPTEETKDDIIRSVENWLDLKGRVKAGDTP